jgi:eukaryotic-like serine/threonine-protein kinase
MATMPPQSAALAPLPPPPDKIGAYALRNLIGAGGMGAVYRAERADGVFEQTAAIKLMRHGHVSAAARQQFDSERRILARMHHRNIAQLFDGGVLADGTSYIIMEYLDGESLDTYCDATGLDERRRLALFQQVCLAIDYAHQNLVVHGDIKPSNILVTGEAQAKLLDFGIARVATADAASAGPAALTLAYASPERLQGGVPTIASDIYALGKVLEQLVSHNAMSQDLAAIIGTSTHREPASRYASAASLSEDIDHYLHVRPVRARGDSWRYSLGMFVRRHRWAVAAASLAVIGLVTALAITSALYVRAEQARDRAEHRFEQTRSMAKYMLFDLDPQIARLAGSVSARQAAAEQSSRFLESLGTDVQDNPDLLLEIARGHFRLANIYGYDANSTLNDFTKASAHLSKAKSILASVETLPVNPARLAMARGEYHLTNAAALFVQESGETLAQADVSIQKAIAEFNKVLRAEPASVDADYGRWRGNVYLARLFIYQGKVKESVALAARLHAERHLLPKSPGQQVEHDFLTTVNLASLAQAQFELGQYQAAFQSNRQTYGAVEAIIKNGRGGFEIESLAPVALSGMGDCMQKLGKPREAIGYIKQALEYGMRLRNAGPNDSLDQDLAMYRQQLAFLLAKNGEAAESIRYIDAALATTQQQALASPNSAAAQRGLAIILQSRAKDLDILGQSTAACSSAAEALSQWQATAKLGGILAMDKDTATSMPALAKLLRKCGLPGELMALQPGVQK